jgi:C_GCAxxG_C_C family probable redox protein
VITKEDVQKAFSDGIDCSQVVLGEWAERFGMSREEAYKTASPFGGGMFRGDTCGAVSGAMLVLGRKYGHCRTGDMEAKGKLMGKIVEFQALFCTNNPSTICRNLIDFDLSKPGQLEAALASGQLLERCPGYVLEALSILDRIAD